ncbi:hypothetical protein NDU88_000721 [Pleurodeles waltl]|uniref:Uncharacterized protein n=1 Tax=Pleurodeles waltl TaxID=8319 RepID=A0AAV7V7Q2_PLEWA|nr:hypothetical protein NDU88_000721 [Pleurodeles waltl]
MGNAAPSSDKSSGPEGPCPVAPLPGSKNDEDKEEMSEDQAELGKDVLGLLHRLRNRIRIAMLLHTLVECNDGTIGRDGGWRLEKARGEMWTEKLSLSGPAVFK